MVTIRRRGGLFVASAAVCAALLSTTNVAQAESDPAGVVATSLRGGRRALISTDRKSYYSESINSRRLEEAGAEGEEKQEEEGEEKQEEDQQQYQEGNNEEEQEEEAEEAADEEEEQQQQENAEEENEYYDEIDDGYMNDDGNANDDQSSIVTNMQDTVSDANEKFQDLMDRFDEDVVTMWSTSPSDWDDEFWKVFGIVAGTFTLVLSCILYICCLCCSGNGRENEKGMIIGAQSDADKRFGKKNKHRGRSFTSRMRTNDTDTIGTYNTGLSTNVDSERPFVLIEDVEQDDNKSKSTAGGAATGLADAGLTSPVYARESASGSKHNTKDFSTSTRFVDSPSSLARNQTMSDAETLASFKSTNLKKKPSGGLFNETVEVWSEFLGLKKSKYNKKEFFSTDEDDNNAMTGDELSTRKERATRASSSSPKKSMKSKPAQMKTGTYTKPKQESDVESVDPIVSGGDKFSASSSGDDSIPNEEKLTAQTPVMSNLMNTNNSNRAKSIQPNSPRRTALIKTKNLLRSFGGNSNKSNKSKSKKQRNINSTGSDPKEEALLTTEQSESV